MAWASGMQSPAIFGSLDRFVEQLFGFFQRQPGVLPLAAAENAVERNSVFVFLGFDFDAIRVIGTGFVQRQNVSGNQTNQNQRESVSDTLVGIENVCRVRKGGNARHRGNLAAPRSH